MFKLQFTGVTNDTQKTPILSDYKLRCALMPSKKDIIYCKVVVAKDLADKQGLLNKHYTLQKTCLDNMRDATWYTTMTDIDGTTRYVKVLVLPKSESWRRVISKEPVRKIEWEYTLLLLAQPLA